MWYTYWFAVIDEDSELWGEEFFVEVKTDSPEKAKELAILVANENFPDVELKCYGRVSEEEAEIMGLDTY